MHLTGTYRTDTDSGSVELDFNTDGSAEGRWTFFLASGAMTIRQK